MSIKYSIRKNHISTIPEQYYGRVHIGSSLNLENIVERMMSQGSTITKADILAVLENAIKATENILLEGNRVNFGDLVQLYPKMKGNFNSLLDTFDSKRHLIDVAANPGVKMRNTIKQNATPEKEMAFKPMPEVMDYYDLESDEHNGPITPGTTGSIQGHRLKYNSEISDEGIFLIAATDSSETKITSVLKNLPKELIFQVPMSLTPGASYSLEVRSRMQGGMELRSSSLEAELSTP